MKIFFSHIVLCVFCMIIFSSCENDMKDVKRITQKQNFVDTIRNINGFLSNTGKMRAKLTTRLMLNYHTDSSYIYMPDTVRIDFLGDSTRKVESKLFALQAKYFNNTNKAFIKDSVLIYNIKGDTLKTDELWWDQNLGKIYTDKFVRIFTPDKTIYGYGLEADQNFKWYIIKKPTGMVLYDSLGLE